MPPGRRAGSCPRKGLAVRKGTSITVDEAAWGPAEKSAHHAWKAHDVVEMESFWIAEAAVKRGMPFLAVRAVSDSSADSLPNIGVMRPDGTLDTEKFITHLPRAPGDWRRTDRRLAQNSKVALTSLARFPRSSHARTSGPFWRPMISGASRPSRQTDVDEAIRRTQDYFLRTQHPDGYWVGELETNVCMAAEYLLLTHFLGARRRDAMAQDRDLLAAAATA